MTEDPSGDGVSLGLIYHHLRKHKWSELEHFREEVKKNFPRYRHILESDESEYAKCLGGIGSVEKYIQYLD